MTDFLKLSQEAFEASSQYIDTNYRSEWEYSLRAFRNEHAAGSKYLSDEYKSRSRLFRPKTRSIIRKNEAAALQAAFSNREVVSVEPSNPDDVMSVASAVALKEVMEYRLSKTIPTFEIYIGGVQDAQTQGAVVSYQYWEYETKNGKKVKDKPCIELRPIENIRLDSGASWLDPVNSSPYFCDIIPMYVCDVRAMMNNKDDKTGSPKWKKFKDEVIYRARPDSMDTTRKARLGKQQDPQDETSGIKDFDIVWVMRWFMRDSQGNDHTFYTLGTEELLTDPVPIEDVYFHGVRPYVMGYSILETHRVLKTSMPILTKSLQQETNSIANQRIDNVSFVLNKRWIVARGRQVDVQSLVRNVPGGVTLVNDPNSDVKESNWADVTSSAYVEQDRLNMDFDELAGNFSPGTRVANNAMNDTLGGSKMMAQGAGLMTEYLLRTINETWWEKVLRQLALLEQYYETDEVVLGICANKARLFPRFGLSAITDDLLMKEVNVSVDMAMGDPSQRLQKFLFATNAVAQLRMQPPPGANVSEITKEIYADAGYRDGARFFDDKQDPRMVQAMQMIQQLQGQLQSKQMEIQAQGQIEQMKLQSNEKVKSAEIQIDQMRIMGDLRIREAELSIDAQKTELERIRLQIEAESSARQVESQSIELPYKMAELKVELDQAELKLEQERQKLIGLAVKVAHETEQAKLDLQNQETIKANEANITEATSKVNDMVDSVSREIDGIRQAMTDSITEMKGKMP